MVPSDHLAREVMREVEKLDVGSMVSKFSALGRHGYHPRSVLAVLIYGALIGVHDSTKLATALQTDAAFRLLSGGHAISSGTLRRQRQQLAPYLQQVLEQTVARAKELGLLDPNNIAVDSVRIQAHASMQAVRTLKRSTERVEELEQTDVTSLPPEKLEEHRHKLEKHRAAVAHCEQQGITNFVATNPLASLIKLGSGANAPAHRVTVSASGVSSRIVLSLLIDAHGNDSGKIEPCLKEARRVLLQVGFMPDTVLHATADAGYWTEADLAFASREQSSFNLLIKEPDLAQAKHAADGSRLFTREDFTIDGTHATCPAGTVMKGPRKVANGRVLWEGVGCSTCPLKSKCTTGPLRTLTAHLELERLRNEMRRRFESPEAQQRYNNRIAIVEPVFSNIESTMKYRRATTRHADSIRAEILLKFIAHNVSRLIHRVRVIRIDIVLDEF
jgi:transposase